VHERAKGTIVKAQEVADLQGEARQPPLGGEPGRARTHVIHLFSLTPTTITQ
jgi:hypothetical protein